jgi:hypothetical protein
MELFWTFWVIVVILIILIGIIVLSFKQKEKEYKKLKELDAKKQQEEREEHEFNLNKAKGTPQLTLLESIDIARRVISKLDGKTVNDYHAFIDGSNHAKDLLVTFNESLREDYKIEVRALLENQLDQNNEIYEAHVEADVKKCMELGLNKLMKSFEGANHSSSNYPKKTQIEKTHSWDDLKDRF